MTEERLEPVPFEYAELIIAARDVRPPTPDEDRLLWEGFASTRPQCVCRGTGYITKAAAHG